MYDQLVSAAQDEDDRDVIEVDETTGLIGVCFELEEPGEESLWDLGARVGRARGGSSTKEVVWARVFEVSLGSSSSNLCSSKRANIPCARHSSGKTPNE